MPQKFAGFQFPRNFSWGTATSAHQVEGYQTNNDWWVAEQEGGYIYQDQRAGAACNWWHQAEDDFDRMVEMGQDTHRLSVEWSRIQPRPDSWDEEALFRYREMIEGLLARGIQPMVTLHHFTNPVWMAERGGWENQESPAWFEAYARRVVAALGDKVEMWCTINEPIVLIAQGYLLGNWPPGKSSLEAAIQVGLNMVRAHAAAYHAIHELQPRARVGLAKHMVVWRPHRIWLPTDQMFSRLINRVSNHLILGAVTEGKMRLPLRRPVRVEKAANTLDWLGVNYYQRFRVGIRLWDAVRSLIPGRQSDLLHYGTKPGMQTGPGEWGEVHPQGMLETLRSVTRYGVPLHITENGIPDEHDRYRPSFILAHLNQLWQALKEGIQVLGYYHWSLVDNFEWSEGYDPRFRFGLYSVDFATQERTQRDSGRLYASICRQGGVTPAMAHAYAPESTHSLVPEHLPEV